MWPARSIDLRSAAGALVQDREGALFYVGCYNFKFSGFAKTGDAWRGVDIRAVGRNGQALWNLVFTWYCTCEKL